MMGDVPYYSIDHTVKSLFAVEKVGVLSSVRGGDPMLAGVYAKLSQNIGAEMFRAGQTDYCVVIPEPRTSPSTYEIEYAMIAIPGEHQRLLEKIRDLENQLMLERRRNFDIPFRVDSN